MFNIKNMIFVILFFIYLTSPCYFRFKNVFQALNYFDNMTATK